MEENLCETVEADLSFTLEGQWGLPVELTSPDGVVYNTSENSPDPLNPLPLIGQVMLMTRDIDPDTGMPIIVGVPHVVLRITSLKVEPKNGERWVVRIPLQRSRTAPLIPLMLSAAHPIERNGSLGIVKLFLQKAEQKP